MIQCPQLPEALDDGLDAPAGESINGTSAPPEFRHIIDSGRLLVPTQDSLDPACQVRRSFASIGELGKRSREHSCLEIAPTEDGSVVTQHLAQ